MSMATSPQRLRHDALLYDSAECFLDALVPFVTEGLAAGAAGLVVSSAANNALLADALGSVAAEVDFIAAEQWYRHPARTIAGYRDAVDERLARGADHVRVVGEVQFGVTAATQREWTAYETLLNQAFAHASAWIVCPYDTRALPAEVVRNAERTHPAVVAAQGRGPSAVFVEPTRLLDELAPPVSPRRGSVVADSPVGGDLQGMRQLLREAVRASGLPPERSESLVIAANEILTNGLRHGGGRVHLQVRVDEHVVECEVSDEGRGLDDPFAGYLPPPAEEHPEGGMGLWLARQLCDGLDVIRRARGTTVRLRMTR